VLAVELHLNLGLHVQRRNSAVDARAALALNEFHFILVHPFSCAIASTSFMASSFN
jgi:hypothetical protein